MDDDSHNCGVGSDFLADLGQSSSSHEGLSTRGNSSASSHPVPTAVSYLSPRRVSFDEFIRRETSKNLNFDVVTSAQYSRNVAQSEWRQNTLAQSLASSRVLPPQVRKAGNFNPRHQRPLNLQHFPQLKNSFQLEKPTMSSPRGFSYPPLDGNMIGDARPYNIPPERDSTMADHHEYEQLDFQQNQQSHYPDPDPALPNDPYNAQQDDPTSDDRLDLPTEGSKIESEAQSPNRTKAVPKPEREVTKDANGRFYCNWPNCTEEIKDFGRRCEWSKHMDKHDRPYKCPADGCEKLPGFTYSGGLLRHEREVHMKHGGPRKQLNCPHNTCKRHQGKGFSRQENLNEHLRRVHTGTDEVPKAEDTEEDGSEAQTGQKRKRVAGSESGDIRDEMKRIKQENEDLKRQLADHAMQAAEMSRQILALQQNQNQQTQMAQALYANTNGHTRMAAPPAQMI